MLGTHTCIGNSRHIHAHAWCSAGGLECAQHKERVVQCTRAGAGMVQGNGAWDRGTHMHLIA